MTVTVRNFGDQWSWGSRVSGITRENIQDEALRADLQQLFRDRGVLVFEDVEPTPKMQLALSTVFGPLKDHPTKSTPRADADLDPGVIDMHRPPREDLGHNHGLVEVNGKLRDSFLPWHFDHSYNDELNYAGVLRSIVAAPVDGRTGFTCGIELYKAMDPALLAKIEDLSVLYTLDVRMTQFRFGRYYKTFGDTEWMAGNVAESKTFPRAIHPMIWQRPSGEKVVHFCGFTAVGLENHENPEGDALLEEALQEMHAKVNPYWHEWKPTDMLIWDNHRVLHSVEGCDPQYERRMHRTTIKGDYGLGRFEGGKKVGEVYREVPPLHLPTGLQPA